MIRIIKNSIYCLMLVMITFITASCSDNIDLNPEGMITADGYFKSESDYVNALNGIYNRFGSYDRWQDGSTDDGITIHSWNRGYDISHGYANASSSFPKNKWDADYVSVQRCNNVINNIDKYAWPSDQTSAKNQILGEAKACRAYFYLDLVCIFGHIFYYTQNPANTDDAKANISQEMNPKVVFDGVLSDLKDAVELTGDAPSSSRFGKDACRLLYARAAAYAAGYLNDKSYWTITLEQTAELLKNPRKLSTFHNLFVTGNENESENMLCRTYNAENTNGFGNWYNQSLGGYCVTVPDKALADAYEYIGDSLPNRPYSNKDPRFYETIYAPGMEMHGKYFNSIPNNVVEKNGAYYFDPSKDYGELQDKDVYQGDVKGEGGGGEWNKTPTGLSWKKWYQEDDCWNAYNSWVILRFSEVYLLRAEALLETGGSEAEAKSLVKVVRDRAGNTNDIDEMVSKRYGTLLNLVRNERRVEFADENLRFYDIRRWGTFLDVMNKPIEGIVYRDFSNGTPKRVVLETVPKSARTYTSKDFWWPIPQAEIDLNAGRITQNEGWK
jgi:hypothetical protein